MYRLENNVEWTEELKNAFKHNVTRAKIIYNDSNETIIINENTGIKEISLEDNKYVPQTGFIGQATSRKVTLTLLDNQQATNLENKEFTLYIGADYNNTTYYINYGNFIVNESPENDSTNGTIKIVAYDYMIKFNKIYENTITFPCTLKNYLINICNQANVQLGSQSFTNDDFIVVNNQFEGKTLREVLQHIGKTAFSWVRIGQDNKLYLDFKANDINAIIETITTDDYKQDAYKKANEYYGPINKVTYGDSDIQGQEESVEDSISIAQNGVNELIINDNYFAYTTSKRHELIQEGTVLFGLSYMPISQLELIGLVYLDCNDYIQVEDTEGNSITSRVFSHTIKYNGAVSDSIENEGTSDTQETYKNTNTTAANNSRTEIVVDRANKKIQSIVEDVTQQNNKISVLTQTVDELSSKISDVADVTVHGESDYAVVSLEDINESEPIMVKVHAIGENISYTYPNNILYPSDTTYLKNRILRFTNTNTQTFVDYELPDNLSYYNSEIYDEFYLDYESHTCEVTKRCGYNADGTVYALAEEVVTTYNYPTIELEDGNYTIRLLGYETAYLFARLMASNIYTTQFTTKVEVNSAITQTTQDINLSVNQKLTNYSTTDEMNTAINLAKDSITSTVSQTYITKIDSANNINTAKNDAINSANNSTDNKLTNYYTKTQTESKITQKANEITASVSATYATQSSVTASLSLKLNTADLISEINASADVIRLSSGRLIINSGNFQLNSSGTMTCKNGDFQGKVTILDANSKKMMVTDGTGQHFYQSDGTTIFGNMGVEVNNNENYIAFSIPTNYDSTTSGGTAWGVTTRSDNIFHPLLYIKNFYMPPKNSGGATGELVLSGCNLVLDAENSYIQAGTLKIVPEVVGGVSFYTDEYVSLLSIIHNNYTGNSINLLDKIQFYANQGGSNSFKIGDSNTYCLLTDEGNIIITGEFHPSGTIYCGSNIHAEGSMFAKGFINTSLEKMKKNIKKYERQALKEILNTEIYTFNYKNEKDTDKKHLGFVIGKNYKYSKGITAVDENNQEIGADTYSMVSVAYKAIQEQQQQIEELKQIIINMKGN